MESLKNQIAVVKAIALAFAGQGAEPYVAARRKDALEGVAKEAKALGLRDEVNADGIHMLSIFPGRTATPRMETRKAARTSRNFCCNPKTWRKG